MSASTILAIDPGRTSDGALHRKLAATNGHAPRSIASQRHERGGHVTRYQSFAAFSRSAYSFLALASNFAP